MGKRSWLDKDLRDRWLPALAQLEDSLEGRKKAKALCSKIRSGWAEKGFKGLNQQQSLMDQTRTAIRQSLGYDHFSLDYVKFTTAEYTELNNQKQDNVANRNEAIQFIVNPDEIVGKAVELLASPEWSEVCAGLAVLTGRRSSELLSTAQFEKASRWSVTFTGALKRRGELQELSFEIPTLTTADRVLKALAKVRSELPEATELSAASVNRKYGQAVIRACDQHFEGLVPLREGKDNLYTHLFRAIYATIATFWYCPPTVNDVEFKAAIQGHYAILDEADPTLRRKLMASRHYSDYEIADEVIAQYRGKRKGIKLGHGGVKPIGMFEEGGGIDRGDVELAPPMARKHRSSLGIWRENHDQVVEVLNHFEGKNQRDKVAAWVAWSLQQLEQRSKSAEVEPLGSVEVEAASISTKEKEAEQELVPVGWDELEIIQSKPHKTIQSTENEPIQLDAIPTRTLETKIDSLVTAIAQLVELQTQALTTPAAAPTPAVATRQQVGALTPHKEPAAGQRERKYRPRGETQELIEQAINRIMEHNDQAQRYADKWAITINGLKGLGIKSQHAITRGLEARKEEIEQHHAKHQIDVAKHNLRHRGKVKIEDVIAIE